MSRQSKIRWKPNDEQELRKTVKNFNAKIKRLEKKDPKNKNALPEKVTLKQLKNTIHTRQDFKRELNSLKRFSERGAETLVSVPNNKYNLKITKWQKTEMNRRAAIINRKRKKRLEDVMNTPLYSRGESLGYKRGDIGMGDAELNQLKPIKVFTPSMNRPDLKAKFKTLQKESQNSFWDTKDEQMKENYINSLLANYNHEDVKDIVDKIEHMSFKEFYKIAKMEGAKELFEISSFKAQHQEYEKYVNAVRSTWMPTKKPNNTEPLNKTQSDSVSGNKSKYDPVDSVVKAQTTKRKNKPKE